MLPLRSLSGEGLGNKRDFEGICSRTLQGKSVNVTSEELVGGGFR